MIKLKLYKCIVVGENIISIRRITVWWEGGHWVQLMNFNKCKRVKFNNTVAWSVFSRIRAEYGEIYGVSLRIQSKCEKIRTRKTPNTDIFHSVWMKYFDLTENNHYYLNQFSLHLFCCSFKRSCSIQHVESNGDLTTTIYAVQMLNHKSSCSL